MKCCFAAVGVALCALVSGIDASAMKKKQSVAILTTLKGAQKQSGETTFGPRNCISLSRSEAGSCVISTDCEGVDSDTSQTEFAFDCIGKSIVRHSFGVGGFEASEEFDTDVKCDRCRTASSVKKAAKPVVLKAMPWASDKETEAKPVNKVAVKKDKEAEAKPVQKEKASAEPASKSSFWPSMPWEGKKEKEIRADAVKYGPDGCVSTYKNKDGHCVIETDCGKEKMTNYEYGLVCVDRVGSPVKHLFGKDSFDSKETFDTLIKCTECLGLEDVPDDVMLAGEVATMAKDIHSLNAVMVNISKNVQMLNSKVFPAAGAPAGASPAPAAAGSPSAAGDSSDDAEPAAKKEEKKEKKADKKKKALLHMRHSSRNHHRHHRQQQYDDEEDDQEDVEDDDKESTEDKKADEEDADRGFDDEEEEE